MFMDDIDAMPRSFGDHFRPDARSDYSDLIQREPLPKEEPPKKEEKTKGKYKR